MKRRRHASRCCGGSRRTQDKSRWNALSSGQGRPRTQIYTFQMQERTAVDISQYTYEEFISFLFERDVQCRTDEANPRKWNPWFFHIEAIFDSKRTCEYYVRLFREPTFLLDRFSRAQLEEGFWAIQASSMECSVYRIISDTSLPFPLRTECIVSMLDLFRKFFAKEPLETSGNMWWDSLCFDWHCGNRNRERGGEDLLLQDVMFRTLAGILELNSDFCHGAALHGLGHLHHPETEKLVQRFIERHLELTEGQKAYALAAAEFKVL